MHKIIGVLGNKHHGKDTLSDYISKKYGHQKTHMGHELKIGIGQHLFGFTEKQLFGSLKDVVDPFWGIAPRDVYQFIGTDVFRKYINTILPTIEDRFWIKCYEKKYLSTNEYDGTNFVISDLRFQNEVDWLHSTNNIVIKIVRSSLLEHIDAHESESGVHEVNGYDHIIYNDGTIDDLYRNFDKLIEQYYPEYNWLN